MGKFRRNHLGLLIITLTQQNIMKDTLSRLKIIAGSSFDMEPEVAVEEVFDFTTPEDIHLCSSMITAKLIWVEDGLVGFPDKVREILYYSWPEFRKHVDTEEAIEADVQKRSATAYNAWERCNEG